MGNDEWESKSLPYNTAILENNSIILKSFSDRQIKLDNKIIDYIIKRIARSYSKMREFIYKIDELSLKKKKSINFKIIKEIIN